MYDLIVVGSSFASTLFLHRYLALPAGRRSRVLVLERGAAHDHEWFVHNRAEHAASSLETVDHTLSPGKHWSVRIALGGASCSWWACTPRLLPEDFELHTRYGVGSDWPITYDELEPFYCDAEELLEVSGCEESPSPRSRPYPRPPHLFSLPDELLKRHWGSLLVHQPTARARSATRRGRARCCALGVCHACPVDSKFTVLNELAWLWADPRVDLVTQATVEAVEITNDVATGVLYRRGGTTHVARGELVALGANALFNPFILMKSGLDDPQLGRGLCEQRGVFVDCHLDGIDGFQGSTAITGHGYPYYAGEDRRSRAAALIETWNVPMLRNERGKYRHFLRFKLVFEDFRNPANRVTVSATDPSKPAAVYSQPSASTRRGVAQAAQLAHDFLRPLPLERAPVMSFPPSEDHILGTVVMGSQPGASVVDRHLLHHRVRNLVVLGGSAFPTAAPANPTLTICALSLYAAQQLFGASTS